MVHQWKNMLQAATDLEDLATENERLSGAITATRLQLETATFSTNKGAADLAKFIIGYLPESPRKG
jgi:hypothetical protein